MVMAGTNGTPLAPRSQSDTIRAAQAQEVSNPALRIAEAASVLIQRMQFMRQAGITFNGARDTYEILGYDRLISNRNYRDRYARGGVAGRIVDALPNATWRGSMEVVEDLDKTKDTLFEKAWKDFDQRLQVQAKLQRADKLSQLSNYSVLLIGAAGDFDTPLPKGRGNQEDIPYLTAFSGGGGPGMDSTTRTIAMDADVTIQELDLDGKSPRFALPTWYQIRRTDLGGAPELNRRVHWTRVIHIAEGCLFDDIYGQPSLERVWNLLDDLDKVTGGGAEAFWLRANQGLHLDIAKDLTLPDAEAARDSLKEQAELYKHQLTRWIRTKGVTVDTLSSDVANFQQSADAILTQIAGAKSIPKRILTGSEMGELASSQDRDNWKDQINGRQTGYAGPYIVRPLVDRLIEYNYLPKPSKGAQVYEVKWPHIETLTETEKASGAKSWADTKTSDGVPVFIGKEIRKKWYDMEELTPEELQEQKDLKDVISPTPEPLANVNGQVPSGPPQPDVVRVASEELEAEMLHILEDAIDSGNEEVVLEIVGLGGAGSGNFSHEGRPGEIGGSGGGGSTDLVHGTVVAKSKYGEIKIQRGHSTPGVIDHRGDTRYIAYRRNGESAGTSKTLRGAKELLRSPREEERQNFQSGHLFPDVKWKELQLRETYDYSSTQIQLPPSVTIEVKKFPIASEDLADKGREDDIHVTLKYGLLTSDPADVQGLIDDWGPVSFKLGKVGAFLSQPDYDVLTVQVEDFPELARLNKLLCTGLQHESSYSEYRPHVTIAYLKKGAATKYLGDTTFEGQQVSSNEVLFSSADGIRTTLPLE